MPKHGKNFRNASKDLKPLDRFSVEDAVAKTVAASFAKFDETVDVAMRLGVDPKYSDQMVRGAVPLPNGLGKTVRVAVFCKGEKQAEAREAGADFVGAEDLIDKIKEGWLDFDAAIATPDVMALVGRVGRVLGPRGLMPNAKTGSVTMDVAKAVKELKAGRVEFKVDKAGVLHAPFGKVSFGEALRQPEGSCRGRHPSEAGCREGQLPSQHGRVFHHGSRLQDRPYPG